MDGTFEVICNIAAAHAKHGTTALMPTVAGFSEERRRGFFTSIKRAMDQGTGSAQILGVHWETPFINPKEAGAFDKHYISDISAEAVRALLEETLGTLRIATLAPELPGAIDAIKFLVGSGVRVSIGHTSATYEEAMEGIQAGATLGTHIFNASSGIHHRDIGTVGALLLADNVSVEVIADGHHIDPKAAELVFRIKEPDHVFLVTDSIAVAGTDLTEFTLPSGIRVEIRDGRTWGPDGRLIGSILTMDQAVKNIRQWFGLPWNQALRYGTIIPARVVGLDNQKGSIEKGKDADIIIVDKDFNVHATMVAGKFVYSVEPIP